MTFLFKCIITAYIFLLFSCGGNREMVTPQSKSKLPLYEVDFLKTQDLYAVLDKAEAENKLVYIDIGTKWCLPCQMMKEDVYTDKYIGEYMNHNFISYMVDAEKANGPNMTVIFNVEAYPTLLFLNTKGKVLERKTGAAYHTELKSMGDAAINQQKSKI